MKEGVPMVKNSISIRNIIIILFIVLILTTSGVIGSIIFSNWLSSADETTQKIVDDLNGEIYHQIETLIHVPEHINEVNQKFIENKIVDISDEAVREKFFVNVLKTHSTDIYSFSYGTENGEYYGARRNENGVIEIMKNNAETGGQSWYYTVQDDMTAGGLAVRLGKFDPRTRDWYKAAKEAKGPVFSPIYKHFVMDDLTVSAAIPIYSPDGALLGVLGTHNILSNIDRFLKETVKDTNGFAVIAETASGDLIANSFDKRNFITLKDGTIERFTLADLENQAVQKAYDRYKNTGEGRFKIHDKSGGLYMSLTEFQRPGLNWIVITAIPESLLMAGIIQNMRLTFLMVLLAVLLSTAVYLALTNKLTKPIGSLIAATEKLAQGDLSQRATVFRNDEFGRIAKSFNKMADTIYMLVNNLEKTVKERTAELETVNNALAENEDRLRLILDSTAEAIYGVDVSGNCTFCNVSCIRILGYQRPEELLGHNMHLQIHHSYRDGTPMPAEDCKVIKAFREGKGTHVNDEVFWKADGTSFDVEYYSYPQFKNGEIVGAVVTFMDITERKKDEEKIKYLSCHDSLTGLYNRRCFEDARKKMDTEKHLPISIIFGDVNGLKLTNDIFGHGAGDALIQKSAEILKSACRKEDVVARVGGDEFIILLPNTNAEVAEKIIARVKQELSTQQIAAIKCSMALGCDTKTSPGQDIERTMENAENKMYKEKTLSRKSVSSDMISTIITTLHDRSPREKRHSAAVSQICQNIGQAMHLSETEIKKLKEAGFLHDIGKIILDKALLNKEGELSPQEKQEMMQHPVVGYRILNLFDHTVNVADGVFGHHERWDGSGYPKGLKGEEIPRMARILAVAEYYEAMLNDRIKKDIGKQEALQEIQKQANVKFDPEIVDIFVKRMSGDL